MKRNAKITLIIVLLTGLVGVFGYSLYRVIAQLKTDTAAKNQYDALAEIVRQIESRSAISPAETEASGLENDVSRDAAAETSAETEPAEEPAASEAVQERTILPQFAPLYEQNQDLFGWLRIDGTPIDYPVMYKPNDSEYYLHRNFYEEELYSGSLYIDGACPADGKFYLIYGHNMKNQSMFGTLKRYAGKDYWESHKTIQFDTLYEKRSYVVVAAFYSRVEAAGTDGFQYYDYRDLSSPSVFEEYVAGAMKASLYETGITVSYGDELITLSTCNNNIRDGRFVVVAKRLR